jgi:hypothetical protein
VRAPLRTERPTVVAGKLRVAGPGRWFVYVDVRRRSDGKTAEAWLPVKVGGGTRVATASNRFAYVSDRRAATAPKWIAGTVMYLLTLAFVGALVWLARGVATERAAVR